MDCTGISDGMENYTSLNVIPRFYNFLRKLRIARKEYKVVSMLGI